MCQHKLASIELILNANEQMNLVGVSLTAQ